jgi:hypothetical protein
MTPTIILLLLSLAVPVLMSGCSQVQVQPDTTETTVGEENAGPVVFQKLVEFDGEVHFLTPDGRDTVIQPGEYSVESVPNGLRLQSVDYEKAEAVIVQAEPVTQEQSVDGPEPLVMKEGEDQLVVMVLMPGGEGLQATGFYEGIQTRGLTLQSKIPNLRKKLPYKQRSNRFRPFPVFCRLPHWG